MKKREDYTFWKVLVAVQRVAIIVTGSGVTLIVASACILRWFNVNFGGYEEILVMVAFWLYMIGCSHGSYEKSQITADILLVIMKEGRFKQVLIMIKDILTLVLCAFMLSWMISLVIWSLEVNTVTPVFRIPMAVGYSSMVFGLGLSVFYNIFYVWDSVKAVISGPSSPAKGVEA